MKSTKPAVPYIVWMVLFTVVPFLIVIYFAFTTAEGQFTLENLQQVGNYSTTLLRSIWLSVVATALCLVLAYPIAYMMSRSSVSVQRTLIMLVMLPMWMNFLLRTYSWMTLLENTGLINRVLGAIGIGPVQMINTPGAVVLGMVYNYLPYMVLPLHSVMVKIEKNTLEAAYDLGANFFQVLRRVILPLSLPGLLTGITMVFVPSISTFIISRMLGGGGNIMVGDLIELQFVGGSYNPQLGSAISLVLLVITLLCMSIFNQMDNSEKEGVL